MKNLLFLAVSAAILSPLAARSANMPDNAGDVMYLGNIVANSPMWQWTVSDYPTRLDAKPSTSTTADGVTTYPLNAVPFIAVKGYLPSYTGLPGGGAPTIGTGDITALTDQNGEAPADVTDDAKGAVTFTIAASSTDERGQPATGKLLLRTTELRGWKEVREIRYEEDLKTIDAKLFVVGFTRILSPSAGGSCFAGVGSTPSGRVVTGTFRFPEPGDQSVTAFAAFLTALADAEAAGAVRVPWGSPPVDGSTHGMYLSCETATAANMPASYNAILAFAASAHVLELTPLELTFNTPVQGAWSSTLTVTAYQM